MESANQLYRNSGTTLSFKDWLEREKNKGVFIPNVEAMKEFANFDGTSVQEEKKENLTFTQSFQTSMAKKVLAVAIIGLGAYLIYKKFKS